MTTDKDALLREALDFLVGPLTANLRARITAALAGQDEKTDPGFPYVAVMRFNDHTKVVRGELPPLPRSE